MVVPRGGGVRLGWGLPDGHVGPGDLWELHGSGETLITLRVVVLEADLELDGLEEVAFLLIVGVVQQLLDVTTDSGCRAVSEPNSTRGGDVVQL